MQKDIKIRLTFLLKNLCWSWIRLGVIAAGQCSLYWHLISVDKHKRCVYHHMFFFLWNERFKALDLVKTVFLCLKATSRVQTDPCKKVKVGKEKNQESWPCFLVRCDQGSISHFWPQPVKAKEERGTCSMKPMKNTILNVSLVACKITSTLKVDEHWVCMSIEKIKWRWQ